MGENLVVIQGKLGGDPELKYTPAGMAICKFSLAVSKKFKDKQGVLQQKTYWAKVIAWGKLAETCGKYLVKGQECLIRGELGLQKWTKDGVEHSYTEITAERMSFCGPAPASKDEEEDIPF